jgi:branched-chain amino acid transport system permease protein
MDQIVNSLAVGCTYLLIALGFNLIFGVQRIVNLAYGEIFMVAAYAAAWSARAAPGQVALIISSAIIAAAAAGLSVYLCAIKPLGEVTNVNSPRHLSVIVSTIGFSIVLQNAAILKFGAYPQRFPRFLGDSVIASTVWMMIGAVCIFFAVHMALRHTRAGLRLRAIADNPELALCTGIRTDHDKLLAVIFSSALAGVAALLICQQIGVVSPFIGSLYGFKALVVVIVGGLGNMRGAAFVALVLGSAEVATTVWLGSNYRDGVAFALLIGVLIFRNRRFHLGQLR